MDRHRTDFAALLFGLVFLATGGGYIAHEASGRTLDATWVVAIACSTIGAAFLAVTLLHGQWSRPEDPEPPPSPFE